MSGGLKAFQITKIHGKHGLITQSSQALWSQTYEDTLKLNKFREWMKCRKTLTLTCTVTTLGHSSILKELMQSNTYSHITLNTSHWKKNKSTNFCAHHTTPYYISNGVYSQSTVESSLIDTRPSSPDDLASYPSSSSIPSGRVFYWTMTLVFIG